MKQKKIHWTLICFLLFCLISRASAQNCSPIIRDLMKHASAGTGGQTNFIQFKLVMLTAEMRWAQYTVGRLDYRGPVLQDRHPNLPILEGDGIQYFSDREWAFPGNQLASNPFDPNHTDKVRLRFVNPPGGPTLTFTLLDWNNSESTSTPICRNGFMYGTVEGGMYVISFAKSSGF